ncbi:MAG: DHCW motif cupin fold protein [Ignavibacteriales bacterium]|nr:DHCW motif cupin fold protein [Ignavibacteriales bacterium]
MAQYDIPFQVIDWLGIEQTGHKGQRGSAFWKTLQYPGLRIRIVTYSAGYIADHWCQKGHIVHCLEGELVTEHENGEKYLLKEGMTYVVSDDLSSHRSVAVKEVRLLIIDGDFLMPEQHRPTDEGSQ